MAERMARDGEEAVAAALAMVVDGGGEVRWGGGARSLCRWLGLTYRWQTGAMVHQQ